MRREPPRGSGQPTALPVVRNISANAAVKGCSSGKKECAAQPATSARAASPLNDDASPRAERIA